MSEGTSVASSRFRWLKVREGTKGGPVELAVRQHPANALPPRSLTRKRSPSSLARQASMRGYDISPGLPEAPLHGAEGSTVRCHRAVADAGEIGRSGEAHAEVEFGSQQFENASDARFAIHGEAPQIRTADENGACS